MLIHKLIVGVLAYALIAIAMLAGRRAEQNELNTALDVRAGRRNWPAVAALVVGAALVAVA